MGRPTSLPRLASPSQTLSHLHVAVSISGSLFVGVLTTQDLLFEVYVRAPDCRNSRFGFDWTVSWQSQV